MASIFRYSILLFISGIVFGSFFPDSSPWVPILIMIFTLAVAGTWQNRLSFIVVVMAFFLSMGYFLSAHAESFWSVDRPSIRVSGVAEIVRSPVMGESYREAAVSLSSCDEDSCPRELIMARFPILEDVAYGDKGSFSCVLEPPDTSWKMYYAKDGIAYRCRGPIWKKTGEARPIRRALLGMASRFESAIAHALPEPESSLAVGLLIGGDSGLPASAREDFRAAGLTHIVAVSGFNISIIAEYFLLFGVALFLPRRKAALFAMAGTTAFVFVAGAPSSAVRALFMASTLLLAQWFGRRYASPWALLFAAAIMLLMNPLLLRSDIGFQLSFLATAGVILSAPIVSGILRSVPRVTESFLEALFLTISANAFLLPVMFANFGKFTPVAIPANTVLLPLVPAAMFFSFVAGSVGSFVPMLGSLFAFPAYATLHPIVSGAHYAASFKESAIVSEHFGWLETVCWYAALAVIFSFLRRRFGSDIKKTGRSLTALPE
ncbi:MAG: ComEC/Rec2 family competence protein [Candidatus Moranbacteria bacterium]|nr:ComEC/Rec2 family competence protein [Candidatus Moranbacteria bacterium]